MKVVLDTNIYISALIQKESPSGTILQMCYEGSIDPVMSKAIYEEMQRMFCHRKIVKILGLTCEQSIDVLSRLIKNSTFVIPSIPAKRVREDKPSNRYIEAALAANASYLVTGEQDLLKVEHDNGIDILSPAAFLATLAVA